MMEEQKTDSTKKHLAHDSHQDQTLAAVNTFTVNDESSQLPQE
jgi:hypothetical protein